MSIRTSAKKAAIAAVMVAPLVLAACGSDGEETDVTTSSTTTQSTTTKSSTTEETTTEETTVEESTEAPAPEPTTEAADPAAQDRAAALPPTPELTLAELTPVDNGQAANPEDAQAIEGLIRGAVNQTTVRGMMEYPVKNFCSRVINANGGAAAMDFSQFPDIPLSAIPGADSGTVDSVSDIVVNGDTASAWVVASADGQTDSATQRFLRENGRWMFCD